LIHTDDLYCCGGHIEDPAPGPGISRGEALWKHGWLDATTFGEMFSYDADPMTLARATHEQQLRYATFAAWRTAAHSSGQPAATTVCTGSRDLALRDMQRDGLTLKEAEHAYAAAEEAIRAYGNGDLAAGCERVAERHTVWCQQTRKCD
jgi:hypothetical protein